MSPDGPHASSSSHSGWHSIRPWTPPLSLSVREITSVSVTFTLSSTLTDHNGDLEPLIALGLIATEEDTGKGQGDEAESLQTPGTKKKSVISDALAKGLSVDVNGSPWQRVFIRIEDGADEAVIIIYGLMPGREYDVKLGLVQGDSNGTLHQQVTTDEVELEPLEIPPAPDSPDPDHLASSDPSPSTPSTSPNHTHPNTPPSTTVQLTIEDRLSQLQHTLAVINTERDTLTASLKSARRDAQKADAALRSEIDILKRASEKHVAADHRAKQKLLSLQEAVKRAQTATRETEELVKEVEELVPELNRQRQKKEAEYTKVKEEAERVRKERDLQTEKEKKRLESMRGELTGMTNKMDKLGVKREKLENSTIMDLEEQLLSVEREVEQVEKDAQAQEAAYAYNTYLSQQQQEFIVDELHYPGTETISERSLAFPYLPVQRMRTQISPGTIGRPVPPSPIQRPTPSEQSHSNYIHPPLWNHHPRQPLPHATQTHNPRSNSLQHQVTPTLLTNPHRQSSLKASISTQNTTTSSPSANLSSSTSSSASLNSSTNSNLGAAVTTTSTLSSRAPAFEPGRGLKVNASSNNGVPVGTSSGFSVTPTPIQRPSRGMSVMQNKAKAAHGQQVPWAGIRSPYDDSQ